jgi:hypothetical protein
VLQFDLVTIGQWWNLSCMHKKAFIKTPNDRTQRASGLQNTWRCLQSGKSREDVDNWYIFLKTPLHLFHFTAYLYLYHNHYNIIMW